MLAARVAVVVLALLLASATAAQARPPVLITTTGESVGMAVDAQGTAHIAYNDENRSGVGEPLMYCAWPKAAKTCTPRPILVDNASPLGQPPLIQTGPAPGQLTIVSSRDNIDVIRSADGLVYLRWALYRGESQCGTWNAEPYILAASGS